MAAFGFGPSKAEVPANYRALAVAYLKLPANAHVRYYPLADGYVRDPALKTDPAQWFPILRVEYSIPGPEGKLGWSTTAAWVVLARSGVLGTTRPDNIRWSDPEPQPVKPTAL